GALARVSGEHGLDAELAREIVPQRLSAADLEPSGKLPRGDAALTRQAGEVGERAVDAEVVVLGSVVEISFTRAHGGKAVAGPGLEHETEAAGAHESYALGEAPSLIGGTRDAIGPRQRDPQFAGARDQRRRRDAFWGGQCALCRRSRTR